MDVYPLSPPHQLGISNSMTNNNKVSSSYTHKSFMAMDFLRPFHNLGMSCILGYFLHNLDVSHFWIYILYVPFNI